MKTLELHYPMMQFLIIGNITLHIRLERKRIVQKDRKGGRAIIYPWWSSPLSRRLVDRFNEKNLNETQLHVVNIGPRVLRPATNYVDTARNQS